jgi:hypothetical protein
MAILILTSSNFVVFPHTFVHAQVDIYEGRGEHYLGYVRLGHIRGDVHAKLDMYNDREI